MPGNRRGRGPAWRWTPLAEIVTVENILRWTRAVREHGIVAVFGANMLPTPPFSVQNVIAGAARIPLWQFMLGTFSRCCRAWWRGACSATSSPTRWTNPAR